MLLNLGHWTKNTTTQTITYNVGNIVCSCLSKCFCPVTKVEQHQPKYMDLCLFFSFPEIKFKNFLTVHFPSAFHIGWHNLCLQQKHKLSSPRPSNIPSPSPPPLFVPNKLIQTLSNRRTNTPAPHPALTPHWAIARLPGHAPGRDAAAVLCPGAVEALAVADRTAAVTSYRLGLQSHSVGVSCAEGSAL